MMFFSILLLCFILTFAEYIIKLLRISKLFTSTQINVPPHLLENLRKAREDLEYTRKAGPGSGEYARFIKTMRAEKKVKDLEQEIRGERTASQLKGTSVELILSYGVKTVIGIVLLIVSIKYRYHAVLVFNEKFNLEPLQGLMALPSGIPNAISVPVWILSCNITFRMISRHIALK